VCHFGHLLGEQLPNIQCCGGVLSVKPVQSVRINAADKLGGERDEEMTMQDHLEDPLEDPHELMGVLRVGIAGEKADVPGMVHIILFSARRLL
jgi:hypothetical protein